LEAIEHVSKAANTTKQAVTNVGFSPDIFYALNIWISDSQQRHCYFYFYFFGGERGYSGIKWQQIEIKDG